VEGGSEGDALRVPACGGMSSIAAHPSTQKTYPCKGASARSTTPALCHRRRKRNHAVVTATTWAEANTLAHPVARAAIGPRRLEGIAQAIEVVEQLTALDHDRAACTPVGVVQPPVQPVGLTTVPLLSAPVRLEQAQPDQGVQVVTVHPGVSAMWLARQIVAQMVERGSMRRHGYITPSHSPVMWRGAGRGEALWGPGAGSRREIRASGMLWRTRWGWVP